MTDIVERLRSNQPLPICPFDRKSPDYYTTPNDKPCKFCGGEPEGPDRCTGADTRIMGEAADIIDRLRQLLSEAEKCEKEARAKLQAMHRRAQESERVEQMIFDTLGTWHKLYNEGRFKPRAKRGLFFVVMKDLKAKAEKIRDARSALQSEER